MKRLIKGIVYKVGLLGEEPATTLLEYLKQNDKGWDEITISDLIGFYFIHYSFESKEWLTCLNIEGEEVVDAWDLFQEDYEEPNFELLYLKTKEKEQILVGLFKETSEHFNQIKEYLTK